MLISAQKTLDEVRSQLPADFWKKYTRLINANIFDDVLTAESHGVITVSELKNGETKFTVTKAQNHKNDQVTPMFVTFADVDYCDLITKISLRAVRARYSHEFENGKKVLYDEVVLNEERNRYDLYYRDEFTGWFGFYELRFYPPKAKKPSGELLRFVSISFTENGREFDYLCDSDDVKVGDKVIVEGYDGETAVTIKRVFSKNESELGLAKERYKKILRKA